MTTPQITSLPLWVPKDSLVEVIKAQFSTGELMRNVREKLTSVTSSSPKTVDQHAKETLLSVATYIEKNGCPLVVVMSNTDQTEAVMMEFVAARRRENGDPIFQLNWCKVRE